MAQAATEDGGREGDESRARGAGEAPAGEPGVLRMEKEILGRAALM
jgi:hypothetical protein